MASRSYINNNPGNLTDTPWTRKQHGHIGADDRGFAWFDSWLNGLQAMQRLLWLRSYRTLTVRAAIERYAPSVENDTAAYVASVCQRAGCKPLDVIENMTPVQFLALVEAMVVHEGWRA